MNVSIETNEAPSYIYIYIHTYIYIYIYMSIVMIGDMV